MLTDLPGLVHSGDTRLESQLVLDEVLGVLVALHEHALQHVLSGELVEAALSDRKHDVLVHAETGDLEVEYGLGVRDLDHA